MATRIKKRKSNRAKSANALKKKIPTINAQRQTETRGSWSQCVEAGKRIVLGENLYRGILIMLNQGPGNIVINPGHQAVELPATHTRVLSIYERIEVENTDVKPAALAFDYTPLPQ